MKPRIGIPKQGSLGPQLAMNRQGYFPLWRRPNFRIGKGIISLEWYLKCPQLVSNNDVVIVNLPQFEGWWAALWGRIFNKRVICIYHCEVDFPFYRYIMDVSSALTLSLSNKIIAYTEDYAKHSRLLKYFWDKVNFVYPPIPKPIKVKNGYQIPQWIDLPYLEKISQNTRELDSELLEIIKSISLYKDNKGKTQYNQCSA